MEKQNRNDRRLTNKQPDRETDEKTARQCDNITCTEPASLLVEANLDDA